MRHLRYAGTRPKMAAHRAHLLGEAKKLLDYHLNFVAKVALSDPVLSAPNGVGLQEVRPSRKDDCAFLLGNAGLHAVAALLYQALGDRGRAGTFAERIRKSGASLYPLGAKNEGADEMFVGRAGLLCALLNLRLKAPELGPSSGEDALVAELVKATVASGRLGAAHFPAGSVHPPLVYAYHGHRYLGAAHGTAAILQMILS